VGKHVGGLIANPNHYQPVTGGLSFVKEPHRADAGEAGFFQTSGFLTAVTGAIAASYLPGPGFSGFAHRYR
jgi:hypothetical protein